MIWSLTYFLSGFLLFFLKPIFFRINSKASLALFISIGFIIPFSTMTLFSMIGAHGEPSSFEKDVLGSLFAIMLYGFIGAVSAFAAWKNLNANRQKNK